MLPKINPAETQAWKKLQQHFTEMKNVRVKDLFMDDPDRFQKFSFAVPEIVCDFSKNIITENTLQLLLDLAEECGLRSAIDAMFAGEKINETEDRSVLHTALRNFSGQPVLSEGKDVMPASKKSVGSNEKLLFQSSFRRMERLFRKEDKILCKHWDRRKRPWTGDGHGSIEALLGGRYSALFC